MDVTMTMRERLALRMKAEIGKAFNAKPLHGHHSDWFADGGSLDLYVLADAVLAELEKQTEGMILQLEAVIEGECSGLAIDRKILSQGFTAAIRAAREGK